MRTGNFILCTLFFNLKNISMKYLFSLLFCILLLISCGKDDAKIASEPELIWSSLLKGDTLAASINPIIYGNIALHTQIIVGEPYTPFIAFDKNTGERLWTWSDFSGDYESIGSASTGVVHKDNIFVFSTGIRVYAIDLSTGQTLWRTWDDNLLGDGDMTSCGDLIFHIELKSDRSEYYLKVANIHTGNWETIYTTIADDDYIPLFDPPTYYIDDSGDTLLYFTNNRYNFQLQKGHPELICYNLTQREIVYEKDISSPTYGYGIFRPPLIYNGKIYLHVGPVVYCYSIETKQEIWSTRLDDNVGSISFILEEDRLYVGIEGMNPQLYALNPETGRQIWKIKSSGTSSKMQYYNGVIYFNGGGNGLLHALNAQTGEYIWQYSSPDLKHNSGAWFDSAISIDKATGRIYTSNYLNALCFEAM